MGSRQVPSCPATHTEPEKNAAARAAYLKRSHAELEALAKKAAKQGSFVAAVKAKSEAVKVHAEWMAAQAACRPANAKPASLDQGLEAFAERARLLPLHVREKLAAILLGDAKP